MSIPKYQKIEEQAVVDEMKDKLARGARINRGGWSWGSTGKLDLSFRRAADFSYNLRIEGKISKDFDKFMLRIFKAEHTTKNKKFTKEVNSYANLLKKSGLEFDLVEFMQFTHYKKYAAFYEVEKDSVNSTSGREDYLNTMGLHGLGPRTYIQDEFFDIKEEKGEEEAVKHFLEVRLNN